MSSGCRSAKKLSSEGIVSQGIKGQVTQVSGNRMPDPDEPATQPQALKTTIYIYEGTNISQVERVGTSPFYSAIKTPLVKEIESDSTGHFAVTLDPGNYSLFTKVDGKFYANSFDSRNNIAMVTVEKDKVSQFNISVSPKASY